MASPALGNPSMSRDSARAFNLRPPAEGWSTVLLVLLAVMTLGWSIGDAAWVLGRSDLTGFLPVACAMGVAWGVISAKVGWWRWLAHLLGAMFGALFVPILVGMVLAPGADPAVAFRTTAEAVAGAYRDLATDGQQFTTQYGHFMLVLGIICWGTGQYAGYAVFHDHQPLNALVIVAVGLVANMSIQSDSPSQLPFVVLFSLAALFLLIRSHAYEERMAWTRRRIGDSAILGSAYVRAGSLFVAIAVSAALALTVVATSAPLSDLWHNTDQQLVGLGENLARVFRAGGATRFSTLEFGSTSLITGRWTTDATPVLDIAVPDNGIYYWKAAAYDHFDGHAWSWTNAKDQPIAASQDVTQLTQDVPVGVAAHRTVTFSVQELTSDPHAIFAPGQIVSVDQAATLTTAGESEASFVAQVTAPGRSYRATAVVPVDGVVDPQHGLTANRLRIAGTKYPAAITDLYLPLDPSVYGPNTQTLLAEILKAHPDAATNPYDLASSISQYLKDEGGFVYQTDVTGVSCGAASVVECFAKTRVGYCEHYASTMVVLLRMEGVPARLIEGFLPGTPDASGHETILRSSSHAWVEVWFPSYGWVTFDPTGGGVSRTAALPAGPVVTPTPINSASPAPGDTSELQPNKGADGGGGVTTPPSPGSTGSGSAPLIVVAILLFVGAVGLAFAAWLRGPRTRGGPDAVYGRITGLARRLGFAPRPSQTILEFTGALGEELPAVRPELHLVAEAKMESTYGRRVLGPDRLRGLWNAERRIRLAMLRLVFRKRSVRPRRRR